jgi:UDP-glucose:O-linked fucose beta-1,3-glucosyltransferase
VLRAQLKAAEDERHHCKKELTDRLMRVDRLSNKYAIISGKMGDGEEGEGHSQAYYVIKAAQERDELQRQGDELDQQIQKAEREVRALEKTLNHLFAKNAGYKASFDPVEHKSPQFEQKLILDEQHRAALSKYRSFRLQQSELEEEMGQLEVTLQEIEEEKTAQRTRLSALSQQAAQAQDEVHEQRARLQQVRGQVHALLAQHRQNAAGAGVEGPTLVELEVATTERQMQNKATLEKLAALSAEDPAFGEALERFCAESGIPPPAAMPGCEDDEQDP